MIRKFVFIFIFIILLFPSSSIFGQEDNTPTYDKLISLGTDTTGDSQEEFQSESRAKSEVDEIAQYEDLTTSDLVYEDQLSIKLRLKYWGYGERYILSLVSIDNSTSISLPDLDQLELDGYYWIQMQLTDDQDQLGNQNTTHYLAVMNYGYQSFLLLPSGELIPLSVDCPSRSKVQTDFTWDFTSDDLVWGALFHEEIYCDIGFIQIAGVFFQQGIPAEDYLSVNGLRARSERNGIYIMHGMLWE